MKTIILLANTDANRLAQISHRPRPLLNVAGKTILSHLLDLLGEALNGPVIFVAGEQADEIADWLKAQYPQLDAQFVAQAGILGQAQAIALCGDYLDEGDVLVVAGMVIAEAAWSNLPDSRMDAVFVTPPDTAVSPNPTAAITWFKNGRLLHHALQSAAPLQPCKTFAKRCGREERPFAPPPRISGWKPTPRSPAARQPTPAGSGLRGHARRHRTQLRRRFYRPAARLY